MSVRWIDLDGHALAVHLDRVRPGDRSRAAALPPPPRLHGVRRHLRRGGGGHRGAARRPTGDPSRAARPRELGRPESETSEGVERYAMERCTDDLARILDILDTGPVDVLGYSMGGRVALGLAVRHPDRVRSLAWWGRRRGSPTPPPAPIAGSGTRPWPTRSSMADRGLRRPVARPAPVPDPAAARRGALGRRPGASGSPTGPRAWPAPCAAWEAVPQPSYLRPPPRPGRARPPRGRGARSQVPGDRRRPRDATAPGSGLRPGRRGPRGPRGAARRLPRRPGPLRPGGPLVTPASSAPGTGRGLARGGRPPGPPRGDRPDPRGHRDRRPLGPGGGVGLVGPGRGPSPW